MVNYEVFCMFDRIANSYGRPFTSYSVGTAVRSFADDLNNSQSPFYNHPDDYDLYHLGSYSDADASFHLLKLPVLVAAGTSHKIRS